MLSKKNDLEKSAPKKTNFTKHLWFNIPFRTHSYPWLFSLSPSHVNEVILGKGSTLGSAGHHNHPPAALVPSGPACMVQVQDIGHLFIRAPGMVLCARCSSVARRGSKSEVSEVVSESIFLRSKIFLMAGLWLVYGCCGAGWMFR